MKKDAVDNIVEHWQQQRADFAADAEAMDNMALIGRLKRSAAIVQQKLDATFAEHGLSSWEFDMLATLRRTAAPHCLAPTELFSMLMVTSGTMTHRMTQLEKKGWVERINNPADARSKFVQLTQAGFEVIDGAVTAHIENEKNILAKLPVAERSQLNELLKVLLANVE